MDGVRDLVKAYETLGIKAAMAFPAGYLPQVPINDKRFFPLYAKCIELDIPICVTHRHLRAAGADRRASDDELIDEVAGTSPSSSS